MPSNPMLDPLCRGQARRRLIAIDLYARTRSEPAPRVLRRDSGLQQAQGFYSPAHEAP